MSAIGTDRPCRLVRQHFRCWRLTGRLRGYVPGLSVCPIKEYSISNDEGVVGRLSKSEDVVVGYAPKNPSLPQLNRVSAGRLPPLCQAWGQR
jgi:hypothetical protein